MTNEERYLAAVHAMQSGVNFAQQYRENEVSPKHLRVGINSAMVETSTIVGILLAKGLIKDLDEWYGLLADSMEREVESYRKYLSEILGGAEIELK